MLVAWIRPLLIFIVEYVQSQRFRAATELLGEEPPDESESIFKRLGSKTNDPESKRSLNELKTLRNLRRCVGLDNCLRVKASSKMQTCHLILNTR